MDLYQLFEYSNHFNKLTIERFELYSDQISIKARKLFDHILNAHQIWNYRILKNPDHFSPWDRHIAEDLLKIETNNFQESKTIIETQDLEAVIQYSNTKGIQYENKAKDILFHIVNHSTYHRAQIASELRSSRIEPVVSDFIFYKRN